MTKHYRTCKQNTVIWPDITQKATNNFEGLLLEYSALASRSVDQDANPSSSSFATRAGCLQTNRSDAVFWTCGDARLRTLLPSSGRWSGEPRERTPSPASRWSCRPASLFT